MSKKKLNSTVMLRQMWCENCHKNNRPNELEEFVSVDFQGFSLKKVEHHIKKENKGCTPHLVSFYRLIDSQTVAFTRVCAMNGCGVLVYYAGNTQKFKHLKVSYEQISVRDWNFLVASKDFGYKI